jgi:hypothetical protein
VQSVREFRGKYFHCDENRILHSQNEKAGVCVKISLPKSPGVLKKPESPFEVGALHPNGRALRKTGIYIECLTNAQHAARYFAFVISHPLFLLWASKGHKDQVWPRFIYPLRYL